LTKGEKMKRAAIVLLLGMGFAGTALASEDAAWAKAVEIPCHPLITEQECRLHHEHLARLPDGDARALYLEQHLALVEDRVKACACSMAQNAVGVLIYR
jgi:hypothetical protein